MNEQQLARGLGWFSIGLGVAELLAPQRIKQGVGVQEDGNERLVQGLGVREIASGIGLLSKENPTEWAWSRVAGDAMDLGVLLTALRSEKNEKSRLTGALAMVAGITALDLYCATKLSNGAKNGRGRPADTYSRTHATDTVRHSITINRPAEEVYHFWRQLENLPRFMSHLKSVEELPDGLSRWVAKGPVGTQVEWTAQITQDNVGELIAWRSLPGATVANEGTVTFEEATGGRGTVLRVELKYQAPGGAAGALLAKLLGQSPDKQIRVDLHRAKQVIETGEVARTRGQPAGRASSTSPRYDDLIRN